MKVDITGRLVIAALVLAVGGAAAQEPRFDVASIRENNTPMSRDIADGPRYSFMPIGFSATRMDVFSLIGLAYEIPFQDFVTRIDFSKVGTDVVSRAFNVEARGQGDARAMLRTLLAERFGLRVHTEQRELPTWALRVKEPGKLTPSRYNCFAHLGTGKPPDETLAPRDQCPSMRTVPGVRRFRSHGTMDDFVLRVVRSMVREILVVNQTGLQGNFAWDISVERREDMPSAFNEAFEDQLGLKLERMKGPREVVVVDEVRMPTPN